MIALRESAASRLGIHPSPRDYSIKIQTANGAGKAARVHYLPGMFRLLTDGDHVVCAVTGAHIPLHELRYWSVERQEAYVDAEASLKAERG